MSQAKFITTKTANFVQNFKVSSKFKETKKDIKILFSQKKFYYKSDIDNKRTKHSYKILENQS